MYSAANISRKFGKSAKNQSFSWQTQWGLLAKRAKNCVLMFKSIRVCWGSSVRREGFAARAGGGWDAKSPIGALRHQLGIVLGGISATLSGVFSQGHYLPGAGAGAGCPGSWGAGAEVLISLTISSAFFSAGATKKLLAIAKTTRMPASDHVAFSTKSVVLRTPSTLLAPATLDARPPPLDS